MAKSMSRSAQRAKRSRCGARSPGSARTAIPDRIVVQAGGGHWEPAVTLSDPEHESYSPQVAIGAHRPDRGRLLWLFRQPRTSPDGPGRRKTGRPVGLAAGNLGRGRTPSSPGWRPAPPGRRSFGKAEVESEERWIEAASRTTGGEWGHPVELSGPESFEPQIGADAAGTAVAIWSCSTEKKATTSKARPSRSADTGVNRPRSRSSRLGERRSPACRRTERANLGDVVGLARTGTARRTTARRSGFGA